MNMGVFAFDARDVWAQQEPGSTGLFDAPFQHGRLFPSDQSTRGVERRVPAATPNELEDHGRRVGHPQVAPNSELILSYDLNSALQARQEGRRPAVVLTAGPTMLVQWTVRSHRGQPWPRVATPDSYESRRARTARGLRQRRSPPGGSGCRCRRMARTFEGWWRVTPDLMNYGMRTDRGLCPSQDGRRFRIPRQEQAQPYARPHPSPVTWPPACARLPRACRPGLRGTGCNGRNLRKLSPFGRTGAGDAMVS